MRNKKDRHRRGWYATAQIRFYPEAACAIPVWQQHHESGGLPWRFERERPRIHPAPPSPETSGKEAQENSAAPEPMERLHKSRGCCPPEESGSADSDR